ncbi:hypothetical protein M406DRAFT_288979 [Cryphonectria parasitica EP155]|uniref:Uncharacterized protein n=1 Tax=Cryphonectria parasitica (strain ATCC 38755 / EP155) TaxID=660469 RepID=A0A9P4Y6S8_CRYP1|nr:uncharacterized protein M406DRAFT_288979 [Cryphonectria parasitica EP155]KAF3767773.1 hypothetical protein M406DRAFT_288979 [Cryphonectria parasitica EP155]
MDILDIRSAAVETNLKDEIHTLLKPKDGPRKLPTLLLYNERGLQIFEQITYLEEYYLTNDEIKVLTASASKIAEKIPNGAMVIELGSGNLRKVNLLLQAFEEAGKDVDYYALDLDRKELERTLAQLPAYKHVRSHGLWGTYDDGRDWLKEPSNVRRQKCVLSLGSSIGNFHRHEAADFLRGFSSVLSPGDTMLVGLDSCLDPAKVFHAYNDQEGVTHSFILNGLRNANDILEEEAFKMEDWKVIGEYVYDDEGGRHQAFYAPVRDVVVLGETIKAQERIQVEQSLKYSQLAATKLWNTASLEEVDSWMLGQEYGLHMLAKPKMPFSLHPSSYAASVLPSLDDWDGLWTAWDTVTRGMISREELLDKPIKLRNACIFYLGHTPTFLDIQLNKTTNDTPTEPRHYITIFERGIDPDVDNPEHCHAHSIIPDEWPPVEEILEYQQRVRERLRGYYKHGVQAIPRSTSRAIWVSFEHEVMHLETLLYMLVQSEKTLPPPNVAPTDFEGIAQSAKDARVDNQWFDIPAQDITIGMDDPEDGTDSNCHFGWDNEKPQTKAKVHAFQAKGRPITNEEYAQYLHATNTTQIPATWIEVQPGQQVPNGASHVNGANDLVNGSTSLPISFIEDKAIRTVYGLVPLKYALDWPISASYDELAGCAAWMGGRIPTFKEARSIYEYVCFLKRAEAERKLGKTVPAVNGHLSNNGVEETPPSRSANGDVDEGNIDLFIDLDGSNVGFQHWHPVPVTANGNRLCGQGEMGGVWEWTSSPLRKWEGFKPMALYPAYTADFFDEKHNIILGGSWATHPRIAGRKSFVNWYQRNYLYVWSGARLVRDVQ